MQNDDYVFTWPNLLLKGGASGFTAAADSFVVLLWKIHVV